MSFAWAVLEENIGGQGKKLTFLVVALKTQAKTTKSTTLTLQKRPLQVLILHTAAVIKDWGAWLRFGGPCRPNVKRAWSFDRQIIAVF